uniref:Uncharacterized protein n=1 Tax=Ascaris lumbricoides TaxID=6252 RepID=A0A0M3IL18_ASCLU
MITFFQQYPIQAQSAPCVGSCMQNCMLNEEQRCQQCCEQSAGQPSYAPTVSNNHPIYLRSGSSPLTSNIPPYGNTATQPVQPQDSAHSMESGRETANSTPTNKACAQICRPFCACITSNMIENPSSIIGQGFAPAIPQVFGPVASQISPSLISSQGATRGPDAIIADEYRPANSQRFEPILPQGSASIAPQGAQIPHTFPGIVQYAPECASACKPACNISCIQQNERSFQRIESSVYNTPLPMHVPTARNTESLTQQPTEECPPVCMPQCDKQCIHNRLQPLPIVREPAVATLQPTPIPTEFPSPLPLQPLITECLPSTIETECFCPSGFVVCVSVSGSNQCCRRR